jgi:predicted phosphodiesterase
LTGSALLRAAALAAVLLLPLAASSAHGDEPRVSLLAVGDTGDRPHFWQHDLQAAVGWAMAEEDRRSPVSALVLLGDQFYPTGLLHFELVHRVRHNLVRPYCRFVEPGGPRWGEVSDACDPPGAARPTTPIYAVMGNHDRESEDSPRLQREAVPEFVPNWYVPRRPVELRELPGGLSVILIESNEVAAGDGLEHLRRALRASKGPWRVMAAHHPLVWLEGGQSKRYDRVVRQIIAEEGTPVHVFLSGHQHNLQLLELSEPGPPLLLVAGGGSEIKPVTTDHPDLRYAAPKLGFARVDLVGTGDAAHLVASLYAVEARRFGADSYARVASATVDRQLRVRVDPPSGRR